MKRAELTQKMIEMKMSMWEKMIDGVVKERIYESIQDLVDKIRGRGSSDSASGCWIGGKSVLSNRFGKIQPRGISNYGSRKGLSREGRSRALPYSVMV